MGARARAIGPHVPGMGRAFVNDFHQSGLQPLHQPGVQVRRGDAGALGQGCPPSPGVVSVFR